MTDKYALAYLNIDELQTFTGAPASGDFELLYDASAGVWKKRDGVTQDQTFDDITVDALTVTSITYGGVAVTATAAEVNYLDIGTLGTGAASKAVVLDAGDDYVWPAAGILTYGVLKDPAGTTLGATVAEINAACDVSTRLVTIANDTNTLALGAAHANRICLVMDATLAVTLPEATGTGNSYTIMQGIAATSSTIVTADTANCGFHGFIMGSDTDAAGNFNWIATGAQDTITFNGTSTGGKLYDWIRVTDVATDAWLLEGNIKQSGGSEATPLSSAA